MPPPLPGRVGGHTMLVPPLASPPASSDTRYHVAVPLVERTSTLAQSHATPNRDAPPNAGPVATLAWVAAGAFSVCFFLHAAVTAEATSRLHVVRFRGTVGLCAPASHFLREQWHSEGYDGCLDLTWQFYVGVMPQFALLAAAMAMVTHAARRYCSADALALAYAAIGVGFVAVVHGPLFFMLLLSVSVSYAVFSRLRRVLPRALFLTVLWVVQIAFLYCALETQGFENVYWVQRWLPTSLGKSETITGVGREPLWTRRMTWSSALRMSTLRMIAYHTDELEAMDESAAAAATARAVRKHDTSCLECAQLREAHAGCCDDGVRCYKCRTERPRRAGEYGYVGYMAYLLFPPLYLGGPISSYNAFASHLETPSRVMPLHRMALYALRILFLYVVNYFLLHFLFVNSFFIDRATFHSQSFTQNVALTLCTLAVVWLKFAFIWRTSRLFALWCGVEAPENMRRCFVNSVTVRDFWRDWHASFNLWIVRYMYIPMGGRRHQLLAVAPIFLFVALWHDHTLSMLKWATCIVVFFIVESVVSGAFTRASVHVSLALDELDAHDGDCDRRGAAACVALCVHRCVDRSHRGSLYLCVRASACWFGPLALFLSSRLALQLPASTTGQEGPLTTLETFVALARYHPVAVAMTLLFFQSTGFSSLMLRDTEKRKNR